MLNAITTVALLGFLTTGCGQKPSFDEETVPAPKPEAQTGSDDVVVANRDDDGNTDLPTVEPIPPPEQVEDGKPTPTPPPSGPKYNIVTHTFPGDEVTPATVTGTMADERLSTALTMARSYPSRSKTMRQVTRQQISDRIVQGNLGIALTENFLQKASKELDILIVIDNSRSMKEEQQNLATKMLPLLEAVSDSDWQIGVITTDTREQCITDLIRKSDVNAEQAFQDAIMAAGTNGSGTEVGILQAVRGLGQGCSAPSWLRTKSAVAVLIVSDEDNCSNGDCGGKPYQSSTYLTNYLAQIRTLGTSSKVYGLFWHPSQSSSQCSTADYQAPIYAKAVADSAGVWGSVCDADYTPTLQAISRDLKDILEKQFILQQTPDAGSVEISVDGTTSSNGYTVKGDTIIFDPAPRDGAVIRIDYRYNGIPMVSEIALSKHPFEDVLLVELNGKQTNEFTYDKPTNRVTFTNPPAENAEITVTYREDIPLITDFQLGVEVKVGTLEVAVDGQPTQAYTYFSNQSLIRFDDTPLEGAVITANFIEVGDPIVSYPFLVGGQAAPELKVHDAGTGGSVLFWYGFGIINFLPSEFIEGRELLISYYNEARDLTEITLPHLPIAGSLRAEAGGISCPANQIQVQETTVSVGRCGFPGSTNQVSVSYEFVSATYTQFQVPPEGYPADPEEVTWTLRVGGKKIKDYVRDGFSFTIGEPLPRGAELEVAGKFAVKP